ncbi:helix-turn-helix transcriptional regulator [Amycolatopsis sp.]|uniref:helix-turn-helix transcriptional regulator n=1 Tax=Amycolatopsis sp. TaxID=37632 RepID=UPI002DFD7A32|nr:LuxR C-terminal-related transcriptional regulator [Amycolatopsis sp.]
MKQVRVAVQASDPMTRAGISSYVEARAELTVLPEPVTDADVVVFVTDRMSTDMLFDLRQSAATLNAPTVLVTNELNESTLLTVIDCHVVAVLPRAAATGERLVAAVLAATAGNGIMSPDLLGKLLKSVRNLQREVLAPRGLNAAGLDPREIDVLRLLAEGWDTSEIAGKLSYSERTVKNVLYALTNRLNLRNRAQAVAYALRSGVI